MPFKSLDEVRWWLVEEPPETALAIGSRSSLRALPLLGELCRKPLFQKKEFEVLSLNLFFCNMIAWSAARYNSELGNLQPLAFKASVRLKSYLLQDKILGNYAAATAFPAEAALHSVERFGEGAAYISQSAIATIARGTFASNLRSNAVIADCLYLEKNISVGSLMAGVLWNTQSSAAFRQAWVQLATFLSPCNNWGPWLKWFTDRMYGRPWDISIAIRIMEDIDENWDEGPEKIKSIFCDVSTNSDLHSDPLRRPPPDDEGGPKFSFINSALALRRKPVIGFMNEEELQRRLHERLSALSSALADATRGIHNIHPSLNNLAEEYRDLLSVEFCDIDVDALWFLGAGLIAHHESFRKVDGSAMAQPLEPVVAALLNQTAEIHGGFLLGFDRGVDLLNRADKFRLAPHALDLTVYSAKTFIGTALHGSINIELATKRFLVSIQESLIEPSWRLTRMGFVTYATARNLLIAVGRFILSANSGLATIGGSIMMAQIDPGLRQTQVWVTFILENSQQILSFADPFPELKIWLSSLIDLARSDDSLRRAADVVERGVRTEEL